MRSKSCLWHCKPPWRCRIQSDQIWQNFAALAKVYKYLANFWQFISYFAKCWDFFGKFCDIIGLIFIVTNGQILKKNLTIWSHCLMHIKLTLSISFTCPHRTGSSFLGEVLTASDQSVYFFEPGSAIFESNIFATQGPILKKLFCKSW